MVFTDINDSDSEALYGYFLIDSDYTIVDVSDDLHEVVFDTPVTNEHITDVFPECLTIIEQGAGEDTIEFGTTDITGEQRFFKLTLSTVTDSINGVESIVQFEEITDDNTIERRYQTLIENSSDIFMTTTQDLIITYVSPSVKRITGVNPDQLRGRDATQFVHQEDLEEIEDEINDTVNSPGTKTRVEYRTQTVDKEWKYLEAILWNKDEEPFKDQIVINARDITERKKKEEQYKKERQRFSILFENSPAPIFRYEFTGERPIITQVNDVFVKSFGYSRDEIIGQSVTYIIPDERVEQSKEIAEKARNGEIIDREVPRETADGIKHYKFRTIPNPVTDSKQGYAVYADINDRVQRKEELKNERQRFLALFENFPEPTFSYKYDAKDNPIIKSVNESFESIFGYEKSAVIGKGVDDVIVPPEKQEEAQHLDQKVKQGGLVDEHVDRQTTDGTRHFHFRNIPYLEGDEIDGFAVYADITERVQRELDLKQANQELEEANDKLEEFASMVSHDLRNPLNIAKGHLDMAKQTHDEEHFERVDTSLNRMVQMISDMLTLARKPNKIENLTEVNIEAVAQEAVENVDAGSTNHDIECTTTILADRDLLKQAYENLFRNAAKHAGNGVTVSIGANHEQNLIYVEDDGVGIPQEKQEIVLEPGETTSEDGTGLGLAIVSKIAKAHGWEVTITSNDSGGARLEIHSVTFA